MAAAFEAVQAGGDGAGGEVQVGAEAARRHRAAVPVPVQDRDEGQQVGVVQAVAPGEVLSGARDAGGDAPQPDGQGEQVGSGSVGSGCRCPGGGPLVGCAHTPTLRVS
ncbi:hypothetical protein GCM10023347_18770 [Streptomyces chumphonensis]